jgi:pimeloyl-ACP methyl ester carboxylesterase
MKSVAVHQGEIFFREADTPRQRKDIGTPLVLLHGIGSSSGSWRSQIDAAQLGKQQILAWDAPGYGNSTALITEAPTAGEYAAQLWAWLDALQIKQPIQLVGHSLGALIAASATLQEPKRVHELVLLSPALGYAESSDDERQKIIEQRLDNLAKLGPAGMAKARAPAMLSNTATPEMIRYVETMMAAVQPAGYAQAVRMLAQADLLDDLRNLRSQFPALTVRVACGSQDQITPPLKCALAAKAAGVHLIDLGPVGHACAIEAPHMINLLLGITKQGITHD